VCVAKRLLVVQVQVGYVCGVCVVERLLAMHVQVGCVWCVRGRVLAGRASAGGLCVVCAWPSACWSCMCTCVVCVVCAWSSACRSCMCRWVACVVCAWCVLSRASAGMTRALFTAQCVTCVYSPLVFVTMHVSNAHDPVLQATHGRIRIAGTHKLSLFLCK